MERLEAEQILETRRVQRSAEDPRTIEQIAEQIQKTGSPQPDPPPMVNSIIILALPELTIDEV